MHILSSIFKKSYYTKHFKNYLNKILFRGGKATVKISDTQRNCTKVHHDAVLQICYQPTNSVKVSALYAHYTQTIKKRKSKVPSIQI